MVAEHTEFREVGSVCAHEALSLWVGLPRPWSGSIPELGFESRPILLHACTLSLYHVAFTY